MPSPIGHAIAGATIAWAVAPRNAKLAVACATLAAAPDLDILLPGTHRTVTHSVGALIVVSILAIAVTGKVKDRAAVVGALIAAFTSHLLLDWMAVDDTAPRGLQILWPFNRHWYISEWDLFPGTARRNVFSAQSIRINVRAVAQEIALLGPLAWIVWLVRVKAAPALSSQMSRGNHPAK